VSAFQSPLKPEPCAWFQADGPADICGPDAFQNFADQSDVRARFNAVFRWYVEGPPLNRRRIAIASRGEKHEEMERELISRNGGVFDRASTFVRGERSRNS
jgi:hypothetical protein